MSDRPQDQQIKSEILNAVREEVQNPTRHTKTTDHDKFAKDGFTKSHIFEKSLP